LILAESWRCHISATRKAGKAAKLISKTLVFKNLKTLKSPNFRFLGFYLLCIFYGADHI